MPKTLVLVATLDTKGAKARYLKKQIEKYGLRTLVVDGGILGQPQWEAQVSREEVAHINDPLFAETVVEVFDSLYRLCRLHRNSGAIVPRHTSLFPTDGRKHRRFDLSSCPCSFPSVRDGWSLVGLSKLR